MRKLNSKQQKIVDTLFKVLEVPYYKEGSTRLPQIRTLAKLLKELNIQHRYNAYDYEKFNKPSGFVYSTSGGERTYVNYKLKVPSVALDIQSEDKHPCYSDKYASIILALIYCHRYNLNNPSINILMEDLWFQNTVKRYLNSVDIINKESA